MSAAARALLCAAFPLLALLPGATAAAASESPEAVRAAARAFLAARATGLGGRVEVEVGTVDPRLRLAACAGRPEVRVAAGRIGAGNLTLAVRCPAPRRWTVYVTATIRVFRPVLVLARPLARGALVEAADLGLEERDVGPLRGRYLTADARVSGLRARRSLPAGTVLSYALLERPKVVRRGQRVVVLARRGGLEVRSHGRALADGAAGDVVAVRNLRSRRIVEGRVLADGTVRVTM